MVRQASHAKLVRAAALMGAVLLFLTCASAQRLISPDAKAGIRSGAVSVVRKGPNRWRGRFKKTRGHAAGGTGVVRTILHRVLPLVAPLPRFIAIIPAPVGRPYGSHAASGLPRRRRWATLGGHGRNGVG